MIKDEIFPGDMVSFNLETSHDSIFKVYLAPSIFKDRFGETIWHELQQGDIGIVIDTTTQKSGTITVFIPRLNSLLRIHVKRLSQA
jgi:hypothetical protein